MTHFQFRIASEPHEFEQIHRLNYRTFVQEIPQHAPNNRQRLVDKFHDQNNYVICLHMEKVLGMVAVRAERPFSLDAKLQNLDAYLPAHDRLCEIRLLAVEPQYRRGPVFAGLLEKGARYGLSQGYDLAVISGTVRQLKLYKHLGFVPFGPLVGTPDALYQPMYWTLAAFEQNLGWLKALLAENDGADLG